VPGPRPPWHKEFTFKDRVSELKSAAPAYRERHYRGYSDYDSPRFYSERRYRRGPQVYERHSDRWRDRDWD
jgi:hypothetical protein